MMDESAHLCREETVLRSTIAKTNSSSPQKIENNLKNAIECPPLPRSPPPPLMGIEAALCAHLQISDNVNCNNSPPDLLPVCYDTIDPTDALETNSGSTRSSSGLLKYERKSPNRSECEFDSAADLFEQLPWHVMYKIFDTLELRDRVRASMVCKRWQILLTDGRFPLDDVVVLNIFERYVWTEVLSNNSTNRFHCVDLSTLEQFEKILPQCYVSVSVKIWYITTVFARQVLEKIKLCNVKMQCLDIYPYSEHIGIDNFYEYLPDVKGITMRPHGLQHFFNGIDLTHFPKFAQLDTLNLDCINLASSVELPESLTTLEWQSRNETEFLNFLPKLERLRNLQFLLLGHSEFQLADFEKFMSLISYCRMKNLQYLLFKFVKFEFDDFDERDFKIDYMNKQAARYSQKIAKILKSETFSLLQTLQFLKFDLCYCNLAYIISLFLRFTSSKLRIISLNILSDDENPQIFSHIFDTISKVLHRRQIVLHLGLLQRDTQSHTTPKHLNVPVISKYFSQILGKFEASFVSDVPLLRNIFGVELRRFPLLTDLKFIQCEALTDELLGAVATNCINLRKLCILNCSKCDETGIRHFVELFHERLSPTLKIVWKRNRNRCLRPSNFFLTLINEYKHLLTGFKYRFMCKVFGEGNNGEAILIWINQKRLFIQDYDEFDRNRILGIVLPGPDNSLNPYDSFSLMTI